MVQKTLALADKQVPVPGYGAMGLSFGLGNKFTYEQAEPVLLKALESGATFWDTAVVYAAGANEKLIGEFLRKHNARDQVFPASKCGFEVDFATGAMKGVTNSAKHIKEYIEGTIERLGGPPDLYYLHRIDPKTSLEESITTLDELRKTGKTKYIGLSECSAATLRKANNIAKIDVIQAEYSPFETVHETNELIATAKELGVAFVAFSPVGKGFLSGELKSPDDFAQDDFRRTVPKFQGENFTKNLEIVKEFQALARKKGCTPSQLALAWVIAQGCIPIPGTSKIARIEENFAARDVDLTDADLAELRQVINAAKPVGERYAPAQQAMIGH